MLDEFITPEDIMNILPKLPREKMNPLVEGRKCVYSDEFGNHCIAGQILLDLDIDIPDYSDHDTNTMQIPDLFNEMCYWDNFDIDAVNMLTEGQIVADTATRNNNPLAWDLAIEAMTTFYNNRISMRNE